MFFLVAEKILVPASVTCVIKLSLFVLRHNYLSMCSLGRNLCSSGRNMDSWRWIMGGVTSSTKPLKIVASGCREKLSGLLINHTK